MESKTGIKEQVSKALNSSGKIGTVETPAFFTERTMQRLKASEKDNNRFPSGAWLKMAAIVLLAVVNLYTIFYISGSSKQSSQAAMQATLKDFVNEYQPADSTIVTIENNLDNE